MIRKLLLVRVADSRSDLLESAGLKPFAGSPLNVSPAAWPDEAGLSHYGFELNGLKLGDWQALQKWANAHGTVAVLDHPEGATVDDTLNGVGLRINSSAEG